MELQLQRVYHNKGTNGVLKLDGHHLCYTIELPWRNNRRGISCVPEGRYRLETRYSERLEEHLQLNNVPGRTLILIHPANNALNELKGCIAAVTKLTEEGCGTGSVGAFIVVKKLVYRAIAAGNDIWIVIGS